MYMGDLGQQCTPGERFRIIGQKGRRVSCPPGTSTESSGRLGTNQEYVWCYRPGRCPEPARTTTTISPVITTRVPTQVATQVSPQISPTLAQQQASPGASVAAQPQQQASASPSTGISAEDLRRILEAQEMARAAERAAEERKRTAENEELRRQMAERTRAMTEIDQARRAAEADRVEQERFAREQAEAAAQESAGAIPPPASTTYAPSGGGAFPMPVPEPMLPSPDISTREQSGDVTIAQEPGETPWALILLAAAGIGAVVLVGAKKGKRKRGKK